MTRVVLTRGKSFLRCEAEGHANLGQSGFDIACAAVTILLRTAMRTLAEEDSLSVSGEASERGRLWFAANAGEGLESAEQKNSAALKIEFLAEYLKNGFESLSAEFPKNVQFTVVDE